MMVRLFFELDPITSLLTVGSANQTGHHVRPVFLRAASPAVGPLIIRLRRVLPVPVRPQHRRPDDEPCSRSRCGPEGSARTRSQPRSLLSIGRSNSARSRMRPSRSWKTGWPRYAGPSAPAWHQRADRRSTPADFWWQGHIVRYPFLFSFSQHRPIRELLRQAVRQAAQRGLGNCPLPAIYSLAPSAGRQQTAHSANQWIKTGITLRLGAAASKKENFD